MPANHKVSVGWQIVFTFIPIANFWSFYRIRKLQKYLLYVIVPSIVMSSVLLFYSMTGVWVNVPNTDIEDMPDYMTPIKPQVGYFTWPAATIVNVMGFGLQGFAIYLVIIWSRQHNRQFDPSTTQTQPM